MSDIEILDDEELFELFEEAERFNEDALPEIERRFYLQGARLAYLERWQAWARKVFDEANKYVVMGTVHGMADMRDFHAANPEPLPAPEPEPLEPGERVSVARPAIFLESIEQEAAPQDPPPDRDPPPTCTHPTCDQPGLVGSGLCLDHGLDEAATVLEAREAVLAELEPPEDPEGGQPAPGGPCTCQGFYQPPDCPAHGWRSQR